MLERDTRGRQRCAVTVVGPGGDVEVDRRVAHAGDEDADRRRLADVPLGAGTRPKLAFIPTRPVNEAGIRVDPPPSLAVENGTSPAETAAAEPPLEPPGVTAGFQGLRVTPSAFER